MWVRALRLAILRSNVPPLTHIYEWCYRAVARSVAAAMCARFPGAIDFISLRGSLAMGLLVPALSDIDLFVVLHNQVNPQEHEAIKAWYRRIATRLPILDPYPWMLRWCEVEKLYRENPSLRFRAMEGREAFAVVYGRNRFAELPEPAPAEAALAQLFDLKSRLTYFNAFCLTRTFADELEARRKEYMLFKLTLELARIEWFLSTETSIFQRCEVMRRFVTTGPAGQEFLELGSEPLLRDFVLHTAHFRLRRSFARVHGVSLVVLEEKVLRVCLALLAGFYGRPDIRDRPEVVAEHEHFYDENRFLPTSHVVRYVPEEGLADYASLKKQVLDGNAAGIDTVLEARRLLINLSNADPRLGNCTVVMLPHVSP